jgi:hypothetical protein
MKRMICPLLVACWMMSGSASDTWAVDRCVAYGDESTDFTWRLCPAGEKYERQYLYFGVWGELHRVGSHVGACTWSASRAAWVCPDRTIRCDARRCGH